MIVKVNDNRFGAVLFDQIVIGCGSSALNFLQSAREGTNPQFKSNKTLVIGKASSDLWAKTDRNHPMGQPPQLLQRRLGNDKYPALTEKPRPMGLAECIDGTRKGPYVTAGAYTDHLAKVRKNLADGGVNFVNATVKPGGVMLSGDRFKVTDDSGNVYFGKTVIVASGIGPAKTLDKSGVKLSKELYKLPRTKYAEIVDAVTYYNAVQPENLEVLVYGGSATASWAASHARKMDATKLMWLCRKGIDQISTEGNPVGRNSAVIKWAVENNYIKAGEILRIEPIVGAKPGKPRLKVFIKFYKMVRGKDLNHTQVKNSEWEGSCEVHQVVYAVGSDPMGSGGPGNILAANLREQLQPVYAKNYQFLTDNDNDILLAYSNPAQNLWVVGAAVFGGVGIEKLANSLKDLKDKYAAVGQYLPTAGTPPEGIAILKTTIDALTGRMETDVANFDWNRARPEEIANLFKTLFPFPKLTSLQREAIVKDLVKFRADCKFVLSHDLISKFISDFNQVYGTAIDVRRLKLNPPPGRQPDPTEDAAFDRAQQWRNEAHK